MWTAAAARPLALVVFVFVVATGAAPRLGDDIPKWPASRPLGLAQFEGEAGDSGLRIVVRQDGSYSVGWHDDDDDDDGVWMRSGASGFHAGGEWVVNGAGGRLSLVASSRSDGTDRLGPFRGFEQRWADAGGRSMVTSFRAYERVPALAFRQSFPGRVANTTTGDAQSVVTAFPAFRPAGGAGRRGFFLSTGQMLGGMDKGMHWGDWNATACVPGGLAAGPIVVFSRNLGRSLVMSPFSSFMSASHAQDASSGAVRYGLMGRVSEIPAGHAVETVIYASGRGGVNAAVQGWGLTLRAAFGKTAAAAESDFTTTTLGFNTDNGAFYYYNTEPNKTYYQTLLDVHAYAAEERIPYRWVLLDSYWYFKGVGNGVKNWTAMPEIFPDGIAPLTQKTGWGVIGHNRYWSSNTDYARQNGGAFDFVVEPQHQTAIPTTLAFWRHLLGEARRWGLSVYEQDWLHNEFEKLDATLESATLAREWLLQMGQAAAENDLTIQYCMAYMRHALQSVEVAAVTQIRVSDDYHPSSDTNLFVGVTSMWAHALGLRPFKDNFWTTSVQPGNPYHNASEDAPRVEAMVATMTAGPVTPSDAIGRSNRSLIMRSCMEDGTLLQPDAPATAVDAYFVQRCFGEGGPDGEVWTSANVIGPWRWTHVSAIELRGDGYAVSRAALGYADADARLVAYTTGAGGAAAQLQVEPLGDSLALPPCGKADFAFWHVAPTLGNGWTLLGELSKWVPVSSRRIRELEARSDGTVRLDLAGAPGERVDVTLLGPDGAPDVTEATCAVGAGGHVTMAVSAEGVVTCF